MNTSELTPEIESHNEDLTEGTVLFTHCFLDDCYARIKISFEGWRINQWMYSFSDLWSSNDFTRQNRRELEKAAKELWQEKVSEYEEEKRERDEYYRNWISDAEEQYLNR